MVEDCGEFSHFLEFLLVVVGVDVDDGGVLHGHECFRVLEHVYLVLAVREDVKGFRVLHDNNNREYPGI